MRGLKSYVEEIFDLLFHFHVEKPVLFRRDSPYKDRHAEHIDDKKACLHRTVHILECVLLK